MNNHKTIIELNNITKSFKQGKEEVLILNGLSMELHAGQSIAITGESGSGKSTLLQIVAGLQSFNSGRLLFEGKDISKLSDNGKTKLRATKIGFVYQYHHLLQNFTALENVILPMQMASIHNGQSMDFRSFKERAKFLLNELGLGHRLGFKISALSGGQQQRVAIARALANKPALIIADEPTGNLDHKNAEITIEMFLKLANNENSALIIATHSKELASKLTKEIIL